MRFIRTSLPFVLALLVGGGSLQSANRQELKGDEKKEAEAKLEEFFLNKRLISRVTFPAYKSGIELKTDGTWDNKWATRMIKDHGVGIEVDDAATVTAVVLKEKHIEIHLNGGGAGTFGDSLMTSRAKRDARESGAGKAPGGSRINLRFERPIGHEDIDDLNTLAAYFEPLVDISSLRREASKQAIPEEFKEAAAEGRVVIGMDKATVFAIMGDPKNKMVDMSGDVPIEKWQFDLPDLTTRIVTFREGKVTKVDEF